MSKRDRICIAIDDNGARCAGSVFGLDLCQRHYQRQRRGVRVETIEPQKCAADLPASVMSGLMMRWRSVRS